MMLRMIVRINMNLVLFSLLCCSVWCVVVMVVLDSSRISVLIRGRWNGLNVVILVGGYCVKVVRFF